MAVYRIKGGKPLQGSVRISGSKNALLPIMAASIILDSALLLENVPELRDMKTMGELLKYMGAEVQFKDNSLFIDARNLKKTEAPYELVKQMRASVLVLGALIGKYGRARVSLPGGCAIGVRPIDQHIMGLKKLGAEIEIKDGYIEARCNKLKGCEINFDIVSVTGTENIILAAVLADGISVIENSAMEPEVDDLINFLNLAGARIERDGRRLKVVSATSLKCERYSVIPDRIEAGTYLVAGAASRGRVEVKGVIPEHLTAVLKKLEETGARIRVEGDSVSVEGDRIKPVEIMTAPYPGFPTDMQAQFMAMLSIAEGTSVIRETIFENRFLHAAELMRMGANIKVRESVAVVNGVKQLHGAHVMATDLRASASLVIAGLIAEGETVVSRIYHLERGYERMGEKLSLLGAEIKREEREEF